MPKLSELTDAYTPQETIDSLPVESLFASVPADPDGVRRVRIDTVAPKPYDNLDAAIGPSFGEGVTEHPLVKQLFGLGGETRYQLWPERMVREGLSAAGDVMSGKVPQWAVDPETGDVHTSPNMVEKAQEMSALAGTGGLAGMTTDATLGATPFLRPALKYKDKLYKGKDGQQHMDVIPASIYPEFQRQAMSGEDISNFQFGFVNEKGHFLDREKALKHAIDTGLVDPQAAQYGALTAPVLERMQNNGSMSVYPDKGFSGGGLNNILTTQLLADSSKPGIAIEAMKKAQPFFSAVEHNVNAIPQAKMTGDQWLGTLSNKPGVKPEEMQWTGLQDFLMENKGKPVTKEQIIEHLNNNKVELKEVTKGGETPWAVYSQDDNKVLSRHKTVEEADAEVAKRSAAGEKRVDSKRDDTKYHGYQLPGGENYREMLLTLPDKNPLVKLNAEYKALSDEFLKTKSLPPEKQARWAQVEDEIAKLRKEGVDTDAGKYRSSHWDEPNILAHVRMNDRTIDGKKSLHLEEVQSDWHQTGRDKGYKSDTNVKNYDKLIDDKHELATKVVKLENEFKAEIGKGYDLRNLSEADKKLLTDKLNEAKKNSKEYQEANSAYNKVADEVEKGNPNLGVPDAPFKKSWHELALKRMLREAAEKGYDRLSWTPGEAQAARYDLSKQIKGLEYFPEKRSLDMIDKNGNRQTSHDMTPEKLPDFVGKEAAKKLLETSANRKYSGFDTYGPKHELHGVDLKIGGEGMKGFYDQIIPKSLERIGKGQGVKVKYNEHLIKGNASKDYDAFVADMKTGLHKEFYDDAIKEGFDPAKAKRFADKHTSGETWTLAKASGKTAELDQKFKAKLEYEKTGNMPVHYIDIPQSLKDTATNKGFPLFSNGYMLVPVQGNPFEGNDK